MRLLSAAPADPHCARARFSLPSRFVRRHAGTYVLFGLLLDVEPNFLVETPIEMSPPADRGNAPQTVQKSPHAPAPSSVASSTRLIARDMRRQSASSC